MDNINRSLKEYINSNKYFDDALNWYLNKNVILPIYNAYLFLLLIIMCISLLFSLYAYNGVFPLVQPIPVALKIEDGMNRVSRIYDLKEQNTNVLESISKYLLNKYIVTRESYSYDKLSTQITQLRNLSTDQVFNEYYNSIVLENPDSLLYTLGKKDSLEIKNIRLFNIKLNDYSEDGYMGEANFEFESYLKDNEKLFTSEKVFIKFWLPKLNTEFNKLKVPFNFKVLEYKK